MRASAQFVAVTGATASGKTDLSLEIARYLPVEIISMDSRQVYAGMDIGTDKVDSAGQQAVPHHGLDLIHPDERYSAGQFARDVRGWLTEIQGRGAVGLLVGGTGFFLKAVMDPIFEEPTLDENRLRALRAYLSGRPREELERFVSALDVQRAPVAIQGGPQRMSRTIEVALLSGIPMSQWHREAPQEAVGLPGTVFVLDLPKNEMDRRIDDRVQRMIERGLVAEVQGLLGAGYTDEDPGMSGTGYREISAHLRGETTLEQAVEAIRRGTRRYARRQLTWFRNQLPDSVIRIDATEPMAHQIRTALAALDAAGFPISDPESRAGQIAS